MKLRYGIDARPPADETMLYAMQWLAITLPFVIIIGTVVVTCPRFCRQPPGQC
jgi:hypothetical protein